MTVCIKEEITFQLAFFTFPQLFWLWLSKSSNSTEQGQKMPLTVYFRRISPRAFLPPEVCPEKGDQREMGIFS